MPYSPTASIKYAPQKGLVASVPGLDGQVESVLSEPAKINRQIKYIVIESYRRYNYEMNDVHVDQIQLSYTGSKYSLFHENCADTDGFYKDLDFGSYDDDGDFVSPVGESYITTSWIGDSTSALHGPCYVKELDRPFRLYQLEEFSVDGTLVDTDNSHGQMCVSLFDENEEPVLKIYFGEHETANSGYFRMIFKDENYHSNNPDGETDMSPSFTKSGSFKWIPELGTTDGAIYSSYDGADDTYLQDCVNMYRVIKYVAINSFVYMDFDMVDARVEDINIECNVGGVPNIGDLPEPPPPVEDGEMECDGTSDGVFDTIEDCYDASVDATVSDLLVSMDNYWGLVGFFPTFFITIDKECSTIYDILVIVNILGEINVERMQFTCQSVDDSPDIEDNDEAMEVLANIEFGDAAIPWFVDGLLELVHRIKNPIAQTAAALVWFTVFAGYIAWLVSTYESGYNNAMECWAGLIFFIAGFTVFCTKSLAAGLLVAGALYLGSRVNTELMAMIVLVYGPIIGFAGYEIFDWSNPVLITLEILALVVAMFYIHYFWTIFWNS